MNSKKIHVQIEMDDINSIDSLFHDYRKRKLENSIILEDSISLNLINHSIKRGLIDNYEIFEFIVSFLSGVGASCLANWLCSKPLKKAKKLQIDGIEVTNFSEDSVQKIIVKGVKVEE